MNGTMKPPEPIPIASAVGYQHKDIPCRSALHRPDEIDLVLDRIVLQDSGTENEIEFSRSWLGQVRLYELGFNTLARKQPRCIGQGVRREIQ
jgi:hypothetical protein